MKKITKILFFVGMLITVILMVLILQKHWLLEKDVLDLKQVQAQIPIETVELINNQTKILQKYENLYNENNDLIGWIKIDGTNINYPVMYTPSNKNFYLHKNWEKQESKMGLPYLDERCNIENSDNLIIYAHNVKGDKMFGGLKKYKNEEHYKNHKLIKFDTLYEEQQYEIISVFITKVFYNNENADEDFLYYNYLNFENIETYNDFIENIKQKSFYNTEVLSNYGDKFITLSTCDYTYENARLVVVAVKLNNNE